MRWSVVLQQHVLTAEVERSAPRDQESGPCACRQRFESVLPVFHGHGFRQQLQRIRMGNEPCAAFMQPWVAVGVVPVPVSIDEILWLSRTDLCERLIQMRPGERDAAVYHELACGRLEHRDVAAGTG